MTKLVTTRELEAARKRNTKRLTSIDKGYFMLRPAEVATLRLTGRVTVKRPVPWPPKKGNAAWCRYTRVGQIMAIHEHFAWAGNSIANAIYMYSEDPMWYETNLPKETPCRMPKKAVRFWTVTRGIRRIPGRWGWVIDLEMVAPRA